MSDDASSIIGFLETVHPYDSLPQDEFVTLNVYNINGQKVRTLVTGIQQAGYKIVEWNGTDDSGSQVPSGVYMYQLTAGSYNARHKMALIK